MDIRQCYNLGIKLAEICAEPWAISARMRDAATSLEAGTPAQGGGAAGGVPVEGPTMSEGPAAGALPGSPIPIPPVLPKII
jgi:hypothetical protein